MTKEEFEALIHRYLAGKASESEEQMIDDFFAAQERKRPIETSSFSESMWTSVESRIQDDLSLVEVEAARPSAGSKRRLWVTAFFMVILVTGGLYAYLDGSWSKEEAPKWVSLDVPYGQKSLVTLADGTRIYLNGGSFIRYPEVFRPEKREVKLSGEAFFEVTPDPNRPFVVTSGDVTTQVLGTSFNVQAFPNQQVSVTVATGKVQVEVEIPEGDIGSADVQRRVILTPRDQATYKPGEQGFTVREVDLERYLAWKDNTLLFEDASLEEVARLLERWYNVTIVFDNELIKTCRINGKYKDQSLERVLQSIEYMYHVTFEFTMPNRVRLNGNGCNARVVNSS
ncbi:MAG: DUF4974 domain-containing protein [Bacteroidota bacterium]|nr:DUF4974 domain-containing protein [Bacteroidota bacterium]